MSDEQNLGEVVPEEKVSDEVESDVETPEEETETEANAEEPDNSESEPAEESEGEEEPPKDTVKDELPAHIKVRIGRQEKRHQKEMRALTEQIARLNANIQPAASQAQPEIVDPITGLAPEPGSIREAVLETMVAVEAQKQQAQKQNYQRQQQLQLKQQYDALAQNLDEASDTYEDFDEVVRADHVPITDAMRDTALLLPNAADVLYSICKDPKELNRIINLPPIQQGREMVKMSTQLAKRQVVQSSKAPAPMRTLKGNPAQASKSSSQINEKTSIADIMKACQSWS